MHMSYDAINPKAAQNEVAVAAHRGGRGVGGRRRI
jgi:hypothetical protein